GRFGLSKFFQISFPEPDPLLWLLMKPLAKFVGGRDVPQPGIQLGLLFFEPARPQAIHKNASAISSGGLVIDALDGDLRATTTHAIAAIVLRETYEAASHLRSHFFHAGVFGLQRRVAQERCGTRAQSSAGEGAENLRRSLRPLP